MHGVSGIMRRVIASLFDFILVLDACIGIVSGTGTVFDYLVLGINGFVLLLICAHWRSKIKQKNKPILSGNDQQNEKK